MLESPKYDEKTDKYIYIKKAIYSKDGIIFNFIIYLPNDDSRVINNPFLAISEPKVKRYLKRNNNISSKTTQIEFDFVESLLRDNYIEGYTLLFSSDNISDLFLLTYNFPLYYPLCD